MMVQCYEIFFLLPSESFLNLSTIQRNTDLFNGSDYEQSLLHLLENMVPEVVSDAEIVLHTVISCRRIIKWDGRKKVNRGWT